MESACIDFFSIPELRDLVAVHLTKGELLRLMQANRALSDVIAPSYYRTLDMRKSENALRRVRPTSFQARNMSSVRSLVLDDEFLTYYSTGILAHQENTYNIIPIPPMAQLSSFTLICSNTPESVFYRPKPFQERLSVQHMRLFWVIELSPFLAKLSVQRLLLNNRHEPGVLARTIGKLEYLRELDLRLESDTWNDGAAILKIFHHCPRGILKIKIGWTHCKVAWHNTLRLYVLDQEDAREALKAIPKDPFRHLYSLEINSLFYYNVDDFRAVLVRCPALTFVGIPRIKGMDDSGDVKRLIMKLCPAVRRV
ncbi:hypothetical protein BGX29_003155 [Mortierella sp. GBA35]|nr:hypothetical protein BGX29_003155 [Mortierella sp. GBA35]